MDVNHSFSEYEVEYLVQFLEVVLLDEDDYLILHSRLDLKPSRDAVGENDVRREDDGDDGKQDQHLGEEDGELLELALSQVVRHIEGEDFVKPEKKPFEEVQVGHTVPEAALEDQVVFVGEEVVEVADL